MRDNMFDLATLDEKMFSLLETAYDSVIDLDHVRGNLIEYCEFGQEHLEGFVDFGCNEIREIKKELEAAYFACTGSQLDQGRVR
jgi:hypothetical protein